MALFYPRAVEDGELEKFRVTSLGHTVVAVTGDPDAPIPVYVTSETVSSSIIKNYFAESILAPTTVETEIVSYTVPVGKSAKMLRVEFGGENYGIFSLYKNGVKIGKYRTWWMAFSDCFNFAGGTADGYPLNAGDVMSLKILHSRPGSVEFEGRIQVVEITV